MTTLRRAGCRPNESFPPALRINSLEIDSPSPVPFRSCVPGTLANTRLEYPRQVFFVDALSMIFHYELHFILLPGTRPLPIPDSSGEYLMALVSRLISTHEVFSTSAWMKGKFSASSVWILIFRCCAWKDTACIAWLTIIAGLAGCSFSWILPVSTCDMFGSSSPVIFSSRSASSVMLRVRSSCCSLLRAPTRRVQRVNPAHSS